jgi:hypothetical protein
MIRTDLTLTVLNKLVVGDCLEHGKLFPGLTAERCVWTLIRQGNLTWVFEVSLYGHPITHAMVGPVSRDSETCDLRAIPCT